jgi:hypothetical protein
MTWANRLRACADCRRTFAAVDNERRCPPHQAAYQQQRNAQGRARRPHSYVEEQEHRLMVQDHVRLYGWWCPGLDQHQPHPVDPGRLSVHHLQAVAEGGSRVGGDKVILCRQENARLGGELRRPPR